MATARKARRERYIDRVEVRKMLEVSMPTVERLIRDGKLTAVKVSDSGRHHYRASDVVALKREGRKAGGTLDDAVLIKDFDSTSADYSDRAHRLDELWFPDALFAELCRGVLTWAEKRLEGVPARIAATVERLTPEGRRRIDAPRLPELAPLKWLSAEELGAVLDGRPERWPWPGRAGGQLRERAARGEGVWLRAGGGWIDGALPPPAKPSPSVPLMREVLTGLQGDVASSREWAALDAALRPPAPLPPEPPSESVEEARRRWRMARSEYRATRMRVRRAHTPRAVRERAVAEAASNLRWRLWALGPRLRSGGNVVEVRRAAHDAVRQGLDALRVLVPAEAAKQATSRGRRKDAVPK